MEFDRVADAVEGVPVMSRHQGRIVYDHIRSTGARDVLEIGTAHGVSAAFMAAAVEENGGGRITSLDWWNVGWEPEAADVLTRAGLIDRVDLVRIRDSSYDWWLKERVAERSDGAGNCEPMYDFCYIDGAHNFTIDGLAVVLVEKLLRPAGWLLMDDLNWTYEGWGALEDQAASRGILYPLSQSEQTEPHIRAVFELIVKQHPSFTEFRDQDHLWGWARKAPGEPRRYTLEATRTVSGYFAVRLMDLHRHAQDKLGRRRTRRAGRT